MRPGGDASPDPLGLPAKQLPKSPQAEADQ